MMRTTLTLDPDVLRLIQAEAHRLRKPLKQVVNDAIRRGLEPRSRRVRGRRYRVRPHKTSLLPGVDRGRLNALADELEDAAIVRRPSSRREP